MKIRSRSFGYACPTELRRLLVERPLWRRHFNTWDQRRTWVGEGELLSSED